ncbi:MAG: hypothetical protein IJ187_04185 [Neisseriaceae bacterium]|nr:hypothetical protein [Neisseriaceae bacterium]MBQ9182270.1 hypothetical protein [Neisseriaceae bacterium]MBQ9259033.1 hypothetical protein [Neisseriaceae bacterium]MBQ9723778.1 hypothetical protein [Neisseriaceae bacterium]MBR2250824.1 hypothetical protein [Neisseriaceae bacterium]
MAIDERLIDQSYSSFEQRIKWPVRIVLGVIAFWTATYFGANWMSVRDKATWELSNDQIVGRTVEHVIDISMSKSKDAPMTKCKDEECKQFRRYLFKLIGDGVRGKNTMYVAADYNKITEKLTHRVYCEENGTVIHKEFYEDLARCR